MLRVAGSLHSRQSGSPAGSCAVGATWHFATSSTNPTSRLAYFNCISTAWGGGGSHLHVKFIQASANVINGSTGRF